MPNNLNYIIKDLNENIKDKYKKLISTKNNKFMLIVNRKKNNKKTLKVSIIQLGRRKRKTQNWQQNVRKR